MKYIFLVICLVAVAVYFYSQTSEKERDSMVVDIRSLERKIISDIFICILLMATICIRIYSKSVNKHDAKEIVIALNSIKLRLFFL